APRVPAREGAAGTAARARRRPARHERGGRRGRGGALSRPLPDRLPWFRSRAVRAGREAPARRPRVAAVGAAARALGRKGRGRAARLGARAPADEAARRPADPAPDAARTRVGPDRTLGCTARTDPRRGLDLRPRARRPRARAARGPGGGL